MNDPWVQVAAQAMADAVADIDGDEQTAEDWLGVAEATIEALRAWCGDAAREIKVSPRTVHEWETQTRVPRRAHAIRYGEFLAALARELGEPEDD